MLIKGLPKDIEKYIAVDSEKMKVLHRAGFLPLYMHNHTFYFLITEELKTYIESGE